MNKRPVSYLQTDPRWAKKPYRTTGENSTIGGSGCGPTCAAMLIETLTGKKFTPEDACNWSMKHGYKALNQGTYYAYFTPQFAEFGIDCQMLNWQKSYGDPNHPNHEKAFKMLQEGYYLIALMNKGLWTKSGHFVVVWWADGKVRINDPASTKDARLNGDLQTFKSQCKYYWWVDAREFNRKDEDDMAKMTQEEFNEMFNAAMANYRKERQDNDAGAYSEKARKWAVDVGLIAGNGTEINGEPNKMWEDFVTREQLVTVLYRFFQVVVSAIKKAFGKSDPGAE